MKKFFLSSILFFTALTLFAQNPRYKISVTHGNAPLGDIIIELYADKAPRHTARFYSLVAVGFYNTTAFHRVIPGFMIQGGGINSRTDMNKPRTTWGQSPVGFPTVPAEFSSTLKHTRGIISGARTSDPNSFTSQFFICVDTASHLDGLYSIFGKVVSGMDIVDKVVSVPRDGSDNPNQKVEMIVEKLFGTGIKDSTEIAKYGVEVAPNPVTTSATISFEILKDENVKLEITNNLGERIAVLYEGNLAKGQQEFIWNTIGIADGNYFYSLRTGTEIKSGKIVVLK